MFRNIRLAATFLVTIGALLPASQAAAISDHQQCFKVKDSLTPTTYTADLAPTDANFPTAAGCTIKAKAKYLCIDVEKSNVTPTPPGSDDGLPAQKSICYKVKCPTAAPVTTTGVDQFGSRNLTTIKTSLVCAPMPAPAPTTTTTTTTLPPGGCNTAMDCAAVPNGTPGCTMGNCVIASCNAGFGNCNMNSADGCETYLESDVANCGGCGNTCNLPNATEACQMGSCVTSSCDAGYGDCNMSSADGCEVYLPASTAHCGACNNVCSPANATPLCQMNFCLIGSCNVGFNDCNNNSADGCEVDTLNDPANCGTCGNGCGIMAPNCVSGTCQP